MRAVFDCVYRNGEQASLECGDLSPLCAMTTTQSGDLSPHSKAGRLPYAEVKIDLRAGSASISPAVIAQAKDCRQDARAPRQPHFLTSWHWGCRGDKDIVS